MTKHTTAYSWGFCLCLAGSSLAHAAAAAASTAPTPPAVATSATPSVHVALSNINESRSNSGSGVGSLSLNFTVITEGLGSNAVLRRIDLTRAVDNLDRPVATNPARSTPSSAIMRSSMSARSSNMLMQGNASLQGTARNAESIKVLEGQVELFIPSESTGSIVRIPNILNFPGEIDHPVLARSGIEFRFLDKAGYEEIKGQFTSSSIMEPNFVTNAAYLLRDPSGLFGGCEFQDAQGAVIRTNSGSSYGGSGGIMLAQVQLQAPLPKDAQLVLYVAVPAALKTFPFKIENITLP